MSVSKHIRKERINDFIQAEKQVSVANLSKALNVSEATIRRDLDEMAENGLIQRTHGGAVRLSGTIQEAPILLRKQELSKEKIEISKAASALIADGETVFIGSGTTAWLLSGELKNRSSLTVITNSLPVVNELSSCSGIRLVIVGGTLRQDELSMIGHIGEHTISELRADKVIIGIRSIHLKHGLTNEDLTETQTDRAILKMSDQVILLADHSKFNRTSPAFVAPVNAASTIVSDSGLDQNLVKEIKKMGLEVLIANVLPELSLSQRNKETEE